MKLISKHRSFLMGMAILWIVWFHTDVVTGNAIIDFFRKIGYGGVDLFFFLTGLGAYYSLAKNPDPWGYMKRRFLRILPSYYPFILAWLLFMKVTGEVYGTEIIGNLTMLGWWHGGRNQFNWYISAIWLFYLLAPVLFGMIKNTKRKALSIGLSIFLSTVISVTFFHTELLIAFSRLPIFILGMGLGLVLTTGEKENQGGLRILTNPFSLNLLMIMGFLMLYFAVELLSGYLWTYGLWWYPFFLIVPGLALDLAFLAEGLSRFQVGKWIKKGIEALGIASFEIFLIHIAVFTHAKAHLEMSGIKWVILSLLVLVLGVIYQKAIACFSFKKGK